MPALRDALSRHPFAREFLVYAKSPDVFSLLIKEHTGPSTPDTVRQRLVSEVRRILDTHPAVAASAVAGTAVINADLNRLSWGDFVLLVPLTVVVASIVLLVMLRFRWRTTLAILTPVGLTTAALIAAMLFSGRPFTMVTIALPGLCFTLGIASSLHVTSWIKNWLRERGGTATDVTRATWRELARPIVVSNVTTALGFGLLAVIPVTPVQEMALFGAAGELLSGLHIVFVLPKCLFWFGAAAELTRNRTLYAGEDWTVRVLGALAGWLTRLQRMRVRLLVATIAACAVVAWLISTVSYDSTYLTMIQAKERLRVDYARFDAAGLPNARLSIVIRRSADAPIVDAALNAAIVDASADIDALPEVTKKRFAALPDVTANVSGVTVLWANMDNAMSRGQIASVMIMAATCFVTFFLSLRNWTLSANAMFVNVLPVAIVAAILGATGRPIDMATVFIMGISLGIAVDDTSFFLHEYLARSREPGPGIGAPSHRPIDDCDLRDDCNQRHGTARTGTPADRRPHLPVAGRSGQAPHRGVASG